MNSFSTPTPRSRIAQLILVALIIVGALTAPKAQVVVQCYTLSQTYCDPEPVYPETPSCASITNWFECSISVRRIWSRIDHAVPSSSGSPDYTCYPIYCYYEFYCYWEDGICKTANYGVGWGVQEDTCELGSPPEQGQQCDGSKQGGGGPG